MSRIQKSLAVFLSVVLFLGAFSVATPVFAQEVTDAVEHYEFVQDAINNPAIAEDTAPEAEIVFEVEEKRDEFTKVYKKDDGTYTAIMSAEPLHYLNGGEWEEINNSLMLDDGFYTNAENSFSIQLPKSISSSENLTVEKDGYGISFSVEDISESSAVVENNVVASETQVPSADEAIAQTQSSVTYADVAENTDLQYVVTPNSIKENIIVSDKESVKETYTFTFETNGLSVEKKDDGSVEFKDEAGEVKFRIPRPVMTDSALAFSYDIAVELIHNTNGTITLEYSPSLEWVNSTGRVFPINIDPAIVVGDKNSVWVEDTYIIEDSSIDTSDEYYHDAGIGGVVNVTEENGRTRYSEIYTKLNIEEFRKLGSNVVFTEVQYLFLGYTTNGYAVAKKIANQTGQTGTVDINQIRGNQRLELESEAIDYYTSPFTGYEALPSTYMHFNITKPFNDWYMGEPNNGFAVVPGNEGFYSAIVLNGDNTEYYLNQMYQPYATTIVMDYVDMGGYNEKYEYHENSVSRAGKGYVNVLTQQLTFKRDDVTVNFGEKSITLGMIYDSATYDKIKALGYNSLLAYGNNWTPSVLRAFVSVGENQITYYSEKGAAIDFVLSTDDDGNIVYEEQYTDTYGSSGYELVQTNSNGHEIIRPDGNIESFNELGLLTSVTNSSNAVLYTVEYDSIGNRPTYRIEKVTVGESIVLDYVNDDEGLLKQLIYSKSDIAEKTIEFLYEEDNLIKVKSKDENGKKYECEYEHNENGNITSVTHKSFEGNDDDKNFSGERVLYFYENNRVASVTKQEYNGTDFVDITIMSFERMSTTQVNVTDCIRNDYQLYNFDIKGNQIYTYDDKDGIAFYNELSSPVLYTCDEKREIDEWKGAENLSKSQFAVGEKRSVKIGFPGGYDKSTVIYQTVEIDGEQGDEVLISGWLDGVFTRATTNNKHLLELNQEPNKRVNYTNDRTAQIEVRCLYDDSTENDNANDLSEVIVIPFKENIVAEQLVVDKFTLKGDCKTVCITVRFSKNINPVSVSCVEVALDKKYELQYKDGVLTGLYKGLHKVLSYTYEDSNNDGIDDIMTSMTYYNDSNEKTIMEYKYDGDDITEIIVNEKTRLTYKYENGHVSKISSADNRIVRYVDKSTPIPTFTNNLIYAIENNGNIYTEAIGGLTYTTTINEQTYDYNSVFANALFTESSNILSESGKGIGVKTVQDWYGRRMNNTVQLKDKDGENEEFFAKLETVYGYGEEVSFETLNDIKTYINTIYTPNEQSALSGNNSFLYEYDENGNVIEEYAYISENSMELRYSYQYNDKNQLVRYNDNVSDPKRSYTYTYDDSGRVLSKSTYTYSPLGTELGEIISTENYEYNGNVLTEYGNNPVENNVSNYPTSYGGATLTWENNQLTSYAYTVEDENGNPVVRRISYTYDGNGYLSSKLIETKQEDGSFTQSEKYDYTWAYGKLINQVHTSYKNGAEIKTVIKFVYDSYNSVQGFIVNDTASYIYLKNL